MNVLKRNDDITVPEMICAGLNCWTVCEQECEEWTIKDLTSVHWGLDSSVGIATRFVHDGPGIEFRWGEVFRTLTDWSWGPPSPLYNGYRIFPGVKGAWAWP